MKNLVKDAKKKLWKVPVYGAISSILAFYVLFLILKYTYVFDRSNEEELFMYGSLFMIFVICSLGIGVVIGGLTYDKIMSKVNEKYKQILKNRKIHHIRMIERNIDLGNVVKAEFLLERYNDSKYKNNELSAYFDGAIRAKFFNTLDLELID